VVVLFIATTHTTSTKSHIHYNDPLDHIHLNDLHSSLLQP